LGARGLESDRKEVGTGVDRLERVVGRYDGCGVAAGELDLAGVAGGDVAKRIERRQHKGVRVPGPYRRGAPAKGDAGCIARADRDARLRTGGRGRHGVLDRKGLAARFAEYGAAWKYVHAVVGAGAGGERVGARQGGGGVGAAESNRAGVATDQVAEGILSGDR